MKSIPYRIWPQTARKIDDLVTPPQITTQTAKLDYLIDELIARRAKEERSIGEVLHTPVTVPDGKSPHLPAD